MTTPYPLPGTNGLTRISGSAGRLIRIGQFLNGTGFSDWEHAFKYLGNGLIIEAEPGGARITHVSRYPVIHWCTATAARYSPVQLQASADAARKYKGVPYSFLDYDAIAAHRLHIPAPGLRQYIESTKHMICSQLTDQADADAGIHNFENRWPGFVTPGNLYDLDTAARILGPRFINGG